MKPIETEHRPRLRREWLAALALAAVTFATFAAALRCDFVCYDDPDYVGRNQYVTSGLSVANARWAFTTFTNSNWHPLTWLSLQLDATMSWPNPLGFHLTNVLFHSANAALAFLALASLTGAFWRSLAAALLFAVHPLRVESVAWVAERKDVLSEFFGLLALVAYARYVHGPSALRYTAVTAAFALSLLCKPMLVTLPCLLLVLDWWPLGRARSVADWRRLALEKVPLFLLVAASAAVTYRAQLEQSAVASLRQFPLPLRLENAAASYATYSWKTLWPADLACFYPHPIYDIQNHGTVPLVTLGVSMLMLVVVTAGSLILRQRAPYLLAGWLWYLGTLVPVIGLVQVGGQGYADRYTYFPQLGLLVAVCWGVADLAAARAALALAAAVAAAIALAVTTQQQLGYWKNSVTLWRHALDVTFPTPTALLNLGVSLEEEGDIPAATECYRKVLTLQPDTVARVRTHTNLANVLFRQMRIPEAIRHLEEANGLAPGNAETLCNLGRMEQARRNFPRAFAYYRDAIERKPDYAQAYVQLASALFERSQSDEGLATLRKGLLLDPRSAEGHGLMAIYLDSRGNLDGAAQEFEEALRNDPKSAGSWFGLGNVRLKQGRLAEAERCMERAAQLDPKRPVFRQTLERLRGSAGAARVPSGSNSP